MEKYLETIPQNNVEGKHTLIGFRCHCTDDVEERLWYIYHFNKWLDSIGVKVLASTAGIHRNSEAHHFHYNVYAFTPETYKRPQKALLYAYENAKLTVEYKNEHLKDRLPKTMHLGKNKKMSNISVQWNVPEDPVREIERYLQYPLKEGDPIRQHCVIPAYDRDKHDNPIPVLNLEQMTLNAKAEYAAVMEKRKKDEKKEAENKEGWKFMVEYLDKMNPQDIQTTIRYVLTHYKALDEKPPTIRCMVDMAERYAFKKGILDINQIIQKSMNRFI